MRMAQLSAGMPRWAVASLSISRFVLDSPAQTQILFPKLTTTAASVGVHMPKSEVIYLAYPTGGEFESGNPALVAILGMTRRVGPYTRGQRHGQ
jgi:hypothetical protein